MDNTLLLKNRSMKAKWIELKGFDCLNCGDSIEVFTVAEQTEEDGTYVHDGEDVRCMAKCGWKSATNVMDEDTVDVSEGNLEELES